MRVNEVMMHLKQLLVLFGLFTLTFCSNMVLDNQWQLVGEGNLAVVYVEQALYRKAGQDHFFVHVRITNRTKRKLGVDLRNYDKVIYPNQWGVYREPQRGVINEGRIAPEELSEARKLQLVEDFRSNAITIIIPEGDIEYFREFNASGPKEVNRSQGDYLIVSMDGQIFVSDGAKGESVTLDWNEGKDNQSTDVVIAFPIRWKDISSEALVVSDSR